MTSGDRPRRRLSADARRVQLEQATIEVVAQVGFAASSADAIAGEAGVSKGLLWHYFDDLEHLMRSAAQRALSVLEAAVAADVELDAPTPRLLRAAIHRAATLRASHPHELRALRQISSNLRAADGSLALRQSDYRELHERQAALLRRGQAGGHVRADLDPLLLAVSYQGMVDTMLEHLDSVPDLDAERYAEHVADVLLNGIGTVTGRAD